jgi:hypothetical protein
LSPRYSGSRPPSVALMRQQASANSSLQTAELRGAYGDLTPAFLLNGTCGAISAAAMNLKSTLGLDHQVATASGSAGGIRFADPLVQGLTTSYPFDVAIADIHGITPSCVVDSHLGSDPKQVKPEDAVSRAETPEDPSCIDAAVPAVDHSAPASRFAVWQIGLGADPAITNAASGRLWNRIDQGMVRQTSHPANIDNGATASQVPREVGGRVRVAVPELDRGPAWRLPEALEMGRSAGKPMTVGEVPKEVGGRVRVAVPELDRGPAWRLPEAVGSRRISDHSGTPTDLRVTLTEAGSNGRKFTFDSTASPTSAMTEVTNPQRPGTHAPHVDKLQIVPDRGAEIIDNQYVIFRDAEPISRLTGETQQIWNGVDRAASHLEQVSQVDEAIPAPVNTGGAAATQDQGHRDPAISADDTSGVSQRAYAPTSAGGGTGRTLESLDLMEASDAYGMAQDLGSGHVKSMFPSWKREARKAPFPELEILPSSGGVSLRGLHPDSSLRAVVDIMTDKVVSALVDSSDTARSKGRNEARFKIETLDGDTIRVNLTVNSNLVTIRISTPNEQIRDLLASRAWELHERLEIEGFVPEDIDFCLLGGRGQEDQESGDRRPAASAADHDPATENGTLISIEMSGHAFERWA